MRTRIPFALIATALACSIFAAPAQALRARVFVSGFGTDSGTCSFSAPCRSLPFAYNAVLAGGEITILDSAGNNPLTINKALTITVPPGIEAGIAGASGVAITISAGPSDKISLRGLTLDGAGVGSTGIQFNSGGSLTVRDSVIRNFTGDGIFFGPSDASSLNVSNTVISDNGANGVSIGPVGTGIGVHAVLDHVELDNNAEGGAAIFGQVTLVVSNSVSAHNGTGILASESANANGVIASVEVQTSIIAANGTGLNGIGSNGNILATRSTIVDNGTGLSGDTITTGDNLVIGNAAGNNFAFSFSLN